MDVHIDEPGRDKQAARIKHFIDFWLAVAGLGGYPALCTVWWFQGRP